MIHPRKKPRCRSSLAVKLKHCRELWTEPVHEREAPACRGFANAHAGCRLRVCLTMAMVDGPRVVWRPSGEAFARAADDGFRRAPAAELPAKDIARDRPSVPVPIRRGSSFSRRASGRSSRRGARAVTDRPSRRAACGSMRGRPSWPAARPVRPSCPATPRRACWSTPSTMARPTRCLPSRSSPEEIATLTEWVKRGAPWGVDARDRDRIAPAHGKIPGATLEGRIPGAGSILELPAARARHAPRGERPPAPAGHATRSIASSRPPSNEQD